MGFLGGKTMYTGLIRELGVISDLKPQSNGLSITIRSPEIVKTLKIDDSIAINGCCVTCIHIEGSTFKADLTPETLNKTNLKTLTINSTVNLERPLRLEDRLDGHLVQGHVDGVGTIISKNQLADASYIVEIVPPPSLMRYIVFKGSIAVDGVSLTVSSVSDTTFSFAMIPHTAKITTLGHKKTGDTVNLEVDVFAKYAEKWMKHAW